MKDRKKVIGIMLVLSIISVGILSGCITDVKEINIKGKIVAVDMAGVPAAPFVIVAFDNGQTVSPIDMRSYSVLALNLNKNVTVVFGPSKDNGLWYDVKNIVEG